MKTKRLKKLHKKKLLIIFIVIILVIIIAASGLITKNKDKKPSSSNSTPTPTISINYSNFAKVLSKSSLVIDLPEGATLLLRFYNFNSGEREWEKSYVMKKGEVKEGDTDGADIVIIIHSKYLNSLTNKNFCSIIKLAQENGDLGIETKLSKIALAWKFKSMYKYRDCFGF